MRTPLGISFRIWTAAMFINSLLMSASITGFTHVSLTDFLGGALLLVFVNILGSLPVFIVLMILLSKLEYSRVSGLRALFIVYVTGIVCGIGVYYASMWAFLGGIEFGTDPFLWCTLVSAVISITTQFRSIINLSPVEPE